MPESAEDPGEVQHEAADGEKAEAEALNAVVSTGQTEAATAAIFGATAAKVEKAEQQQQQQLTISETSQELEHG